MRSKHTQTFLAIALLALISGWISCKNLEQPVAEAMKIKPPIANLDIPFTYFEFRGDEGGVFTSKTGSVISIPAHAFQDTSGNVIDGLIKVAYREFHTAADILIAGIPMELKPESDKILETAGMFELRAADDNGELEVAESSVIDVALASFVGDGCYSQFYFNDATHEWELIAEDYPEPFTQRDKIEEELSNLKEVMQVPLPEDYFAINFSGAMDVYSAKIRRRANSLVVKKKLNDYSLKWTDIRCHQWIKFKGKDMPASFIVWQNLSGNSIPSWSNEAYTRFHKLKGNTFRVEMVRPSTKQKVSIKVRGVMTLKALFAKSGKQRSDEFAEYMTRKLELEQQLAMAASVSRMIQVTDFGIHNIDRLLAMENFIPTNVKFDFGQTITKEDYLHFYCIAQSNRSVIMLKYNPEETEVSFSQSDSATLLAYLPATGEMFLFGPEDYHQIDFEKLKNNDDRPLIQLKMRKPESSINSVLALKEILGIENLG